MPKKTSFWYIFEFVPVYACVYVTYKYISDKYMFLAALLQNKKDLILFNNLLVGFSQSDLYPDTFTS